ncbi:hypothetical protein LINPERHAP2_LOCUS9524, partial [Linum perenne]
RLLLSFGPRSSLVSPKLFFDLAPAECTAGFGETEGVVSPKLDVRMADFWLGLIDSFDRFWFDSSMFQCLRHVPGYFI